MEWISAGKVRYKGNVRRVVGKEEGKIYRQPSLGSQNLR